MPLDLQEPKVGQLVTPNCVATFTLSMFNVHGENETSGFTSRAGGKMHKGDLGIITEVFGRKVKLITATNKIGWVWMDYLDVVQ